MVIIPFSLATCGKQGRDLASGLLDEGPQVADGTQAQTPCAEASARRRKSSES